MVGSYEEGTSLRDLLFQMKYIFAGSGRRLSSGLFKLPEDMAFNIISSAIYEGDNDVFEYVMDDFLPARLNVCISVDIFFYGKFSCRKRACCKNYLWKNRWW